MATPMARRTRGLAMTIDPFPDDARPTIVHVRTHVLSDRKAPFLRQTILGLRPWFRNVVVTPDVDCINPSDVHVEKASLATLRDPAACFAFASHLRDAYPSIALVVGHMGNGCRTGAPLADALDVPLLGIFGGSDVNVEFPSPTYRTAYEDLLRLPSARFLTVASYLRDKLIAHGAPTDRIAAWHRGVDFTKVRRATHADRADGRLRVVVVARLLEVKGHEHLVRALPLLRQRGVRVALLLLGDGPLQAELERLARDLGVAEDVTFGGHVDHAEVLRRLADADVCAHPSVTCAEGRTEGVPNAIMEAHAAGLPVVATDSGGIGEAVLDGRTGFLVPERDPQALADALARLAVDRGLRIRMGEAGRAHVEAEFALTRQSRRLAAHAMHSIRAGALFTARRWRKHVATPGAVASQREMDANKLLRDIGRARFESRIPIVGAVVGLARRVMWKLALRPYLRVFVGQLDRFAFAATQLHVANLRAGAGAGAGGGGNVDHGAARAGHAPTMREVACGDCPHCPIGAPWPDAPCPMDAACLATLEAEHAGSPAAAPQAHPQGALALDDATIPADGSLPHGDASHAKVSLRGSLQHVTDLPRLMREIARVLRPDGALDADVGPLSDGAAGARLHGDLRTPFAHRLFGPELLAARLGAPLRQIRRITAAELHAAAESAGLALVRGDATPRHATPCAMSFQARFAGRLRELGLARADAAPHWVAVHQPREHVAAAARRGSTPGADVG
jgi:glycosyltransferase involved in cell wall biosynthesis